ncbi:hypothetical protein ACSS6W_004926 [Trichoderma asperelloides]
MNLGKRNAATMAKKKKKERPWHDLSDFIDEKERERKKKLSRVRNVPCITSSDYIDVSRR